MRLHLYLSPHLDDAVLSCGGLIAQQVRAGERVLVLTVFAGDPPPGELSPFAGLLAALWGADEDPVALRRAEDRAAVERLGAAWEHWEYPDCIFRRAAGTGEPLYPTQEAIFGDVHPAERTALTEELAGRLEAYCAARRPATVYSLLTAGHHVDHQLLQWAARRLAAQGWHVRHYEDYPYVAEPGRLAAALDEAGGEWQPEIERLTPEALLAKLDAVALYRSQMTTLFGDEEAMREHVSAYAHSLSPEGPAERYWRQRGSEAKP